jgi:hypothetical protein
MFLEQTTYAVKISQIIVLKLVVFAPRELGELPLCFRGGKQHQQWTRRFLPLSLLLSLIRIQIQASSRKKKTPRSGGRRGCRRLAAVW